ncbi:MULTISPECIES: phage baseplate protein [Morganella]|uniref:phage baseplate protein n=1 Tax=Morganella TaxID=581 RepID=UPI0008A2B8ED|nr:phage tail protein [Morganella sp. HMSC11D09]OFU96839.1 phage tail protein [Morganella sp. HMSC11D09]HCT9045043.1 phage tail protein [Morganella morganii]HDS6455736.1 phage tail protein [Morganella morganii subsp. morganii]HDU8701581.1 phage tail protein [Morganella morganii subsp. morganii]
MTKLFKVPFATQGDRAAIPDEVRADGAVSYTQGYGYDYERDQATDPAAKDIEREKMNSLFHDITEAVGEMQSFGVPVWQEAGKPYAVRSVVYHKNKTWQSKVENNTTEPVAGTAWAELKADLTAGEVGAYSKGESDQKFQPAGNYLPEGYSYSKAESDTHFQPKGNYAPAGNYALKTDVYTKTEGDGRYQPKGNYQPAGEYALNADLNKKMDKTAVVQNTGNSFTSVMSQNAVTVALKNAVNIDTIYPVGVVIWFAQNKNPNDLFPGTSWSYIGENKTIRLANSSGSNVLTSGGSDNITLTAAHLPAHSHSFSGTTSSFDYGTKTTNNTGGHTHTYTLLNYNTNRGYDVGGNSNSGWDTKTTSNAGAHTHFVAIGAHNHSFSGTTGNTGSGSLISVVNAYITLMGWYRTK